MALELIVTEVGEIKFTNPPSGTPPPVPPDAVYSGNVAPTDSGVTATLSTKCKAGGNGICTDEFQFIWSASTPCPYTSATHTFVSGVGSLVATATKTKAEGKLVIRAGDEGSCAGLWTPPTGPPNIACACKITIDDAGQMKAKAQ